MEAKKIKIEIKNRWTGSVLFEYEAVDNDIKQTLEKAVENSAYLQGADLRGADLRGADLQRADLRGADLRGAYLQRADLRGAYLQGAKNIPFVPTTCPSDGAFIGWKKVVDGSRYLVKLLIPEDAKRCSSTGRKCRCSKAQVLDIYDIDNDMAEVDSCTNRQYVETIYKVGCEVLPDKFDDNRWEECSNGIHFFINKQEAIDY